jgi:hypothetical protein
MLYGIAVAEAAQSTRFEIARPTDKYVEVAISYKQPVP